MRTEKRGIMMFVLAVVLAVSGVLLVAGELPGAAPGWQAGFELLVNADFEGPVERQMPAGWFKAMLPEQTDNLRAGVEEVPQRGKVAFIEQAGVKVRLANNWAQRVNTIPIGATVRVTADVKTQNLPADTGFVMVQCWDKAERLVGAGSSQTVGPIGGTTDWRQVSFEFVVPAGTDAMILRCGLAQSGKIWFDNVSMRVIASPGSAGGIAGNLRTGGFEVTEESLGQLERVTACSDGLAAYAQQQLGAAVRVRREVFAQGGGKFQVVLSLDLSKPE